MSAIILIWAKLSVALSLISQMPLVCPKTSQAEPWSLFFFSVRYASDSGVRWWERLCFLPLTATGPLREASDSPPFPLSCPCEGRQGIDMAFISPVTSHFLLQNLCMNMRQKETQAGRRWESGGLQENERRVLKVGHAVEKYLEKVPRRLKPLCSPWYRFRGNPIACIHFLHLNWVEGFFSSNCFQVQNAKVYEITTIICLGQAFIKDELTCSHSNYGSGQLIRRFEDQTPALLNCPGRTLDEALNPLGCWRGVSYNMPSF